MKPVEIKQHDDGTYYSRPYLGTNAVTGKPIRPYKRFPEAADEEEAAELAREWLDGLEGAAGMRTTMRLTDVLHRYVDSLESRGQPANTVKAYRGLVRRYVEPNVGNLDVDELRPHLVESLYNVVMLRGGKGGRPVSASTVAQLHWFLRGAYRWMTRMEISPFNPMPSVAAPSLRHAEAAVFDAGQFALLSRALEQGMSDASTERAAVFERNAAMAAYLSLWTSERCGEVCANVRADAQLDRGLVHVGHTMVEARGALVRQPKTKGGRSRNVSVSGEVCAQLRRHFGWQSAYVDASGDDAATAICCPLGGGFLRPSAVSAAFSRLRDRVGLPKSTSFHSLRHTHATYLVMSGEDMRTVQERLGHANVATTLSLYAHVLPGRDQEAARAFEGAAKGIGGGTHGTR